MSDRYGGLQGDSVARSSINHDVRDKKAYKGIDVLREEHAHYRSIVGSLLYIETKSQPVIAFSSSILGSYVSSLTNVNMAQAKRASRYLRSTRYKISIMKPAASN